MPAIISMPVLNPYQHRFTGADVQRAARRCAEVAQERPSWPQARVRALVAREMKLTTRQLRYLLGQAAGLEQPTVDTDAPALAA